MICLKERPRENADNTLIDDFLEWMSSPEGQLSERELFEVMDSLENCSVDPVMRVIVGDGVLINQPDGK